MELKKILETREISRQPLDDPGIPSWMNDANFEKKAYCKRKQIIQKWRKLLNRRKEHYWNCFKSGKYYEIYSNWVGLEAPNFPRKYIITEIPGEPIEEMHLR